MKAAFLALVCLLLFGLTPSDRRQQSIDNSTPEKAVQSFISAFNAKDVKTLMALVQNSEDRDSFVGPFIETSAKNNVFTGSNFHSIVNGEEAVVVFVLGDARNDQSFQAEDMIRLVHSDKGWLIAQPSVDDVTTSAGLSALALALSRPNSLAANVHMGQKVACARNCRQCGLAMIMYAADYNDVMKVPASQAAVRKALHGYMKSDELWKCPSTGEIAFSYNVQLAGKSFVEPNDPVHTVLVYEGKEGKLDFRHDGIANVCFCDGHVAAISEEKVKTLLWK